MTGEAWSWRCQKCDRLLHWDDVVRARDERYWHWDAIRRDYCGPVEKVEVR